MGEKEMRRKSESDNGEGRDEERGERVRERMGMGEMKREEKE